MKKSGQEYSCRESIIVASKVKVYPKIKEMMISLNALCGLNDVDNTTLCASIP